MTAYVIVNVYITNPEQIKEYQKLATWAATSHGAEYLVRGGQTDVLEWSEGNVPARTVVMKFPSMAAARGWYESQQYLRARNARVGAAKMNMYIVEGL